MIYPFPSLRCHGHRPCHSKPTILNLVNLAQCSISHHLLDLFAHTNILEGLNAANDLQFALFALVKCLIRSLKAREYKIGQGDRTYVQRNCSRLCSSEWIGGQKRGTGERLQPPFVSLVSEQKKNLVKILDDGQWLGDHSLSMQENGNATSGIEGTHEFVVLQDHSIIRRWKIYSLLRHRQHSSTRRRSPSSWGLKSHLKNK